MGNALLLALSLLRLLLLRLQRALIRPHQRAARGFDARGGLPRRLAMAPAGPYHQVLSLAFPLFPRRRIARGLVPTVPLPHNLFDLQPLSR